MAGQKTHGVRHARLAANVAFVAEPKIYYHFKKARSLQTEFKNEVAAIGYQLYLSSMSQ